MQTLVPSIPDSAPFTPEQRAWLNGFVAGLFSRSPVSHTATAPQATAPSPLVPLTILFGSQTGTAERLAKRAAKEAGKRGFAPTVLDMVQADATQLSTEKNVLVITSTHGDGEPPDNARKLLAALIDDRVPSLDRIRFSVCALGDRNYTQFCKCGRDFDLALEKRGATRTSPRAECDLDYDATFTQWLDRALTSFSSTTPPVAPTEPTPPARAAAEPKDTHNRTNPFPALLLASRKLNGDASAKEVRHVEFSIEGARLAYDAGDALGVIPQNEPEVVTAILDALGCDGEEAVPTPDGVRTSLRYALTTGYDLGKPTPELLNAFSTSRHGGAALAVAGHHVIDVLLAYPETKFDPVSFVALLKRLQPRLYSISSSPKAHPRQVHLTVGAIRYETDGRRRHGVCSTFLADRVTPGETRVDVFVHRTVFRPPANGDTPMIMVGPGTGIAPFRAFLQERQATGAGGRNWLFFGAQHAATDFLYSDELTALQRAGVLTRLDTAFSRDQVEKIYVQHRMLENAAELYAWLEAGAHFYVCGDATRMAKDVDVALHEVIRKAGGKNSDEAAEYVDALRATRRYQRDIY